MASAVFGARQAQPSRRLRQQAPHHLSRQTRTPLYRKSQVKATTTDISFCESYADAERSMLSRVKKLLSGMRADTGASLVACSGDLHHCKHRLNVYQFLGAMFTCVSGHLRPSPHSEPA